jgi:predicted GIY-YIG superfamily endonuclease
VTADWTVYRAYANDDLMYVGVTRNFHDRRIAHRRASPWYGQVTRWVLETFQGEADALEAEARTIARESPAANIHYNNN